MGMMTGRAYRAEGVFYGFIANGIDRGHDARNGFHRDMAGCAAVQHVVYMIFRMDRFDLPLHLFLIVE